ncbi:hypothetical protein [Brevibacillus reuszeri]|uniref:hypothetical protein n=1 Tax=Brevibacillus reuszeri TaxID=54915 RepID=UPI00289C358D|nr:hypothetical protein [Brevibacillus reuszeri]
MFAKHTEALRLIATNLNREKIEWALGGSAMLTAYDLCPQANDLDILVTAQDAERAHEIVKLLGTHSEKASKEPYCTVYFTHYRFASTTVDMLGLFGIHHEEGTYWLDWRPEKNDRIVRLSGDIDVPLASLEDWYTLYSLIPGKMERAEGIETYWKQSTGPDPDRLRKVLERQLPGFLRTRIHQLIEEAGNVEEMSAL